MKHTIEEIKRMLGEITPGEWINHFTSIYLPGGGFDIRNAPNAEENAQFIAAAPAIIRDLLAENERWRKFYPNHAAAYDAGIKDAEARAAQVRRETAEMCALIAENFDLEDSDKPGEWIARAIRARFGEGK